MRPVRGQCISCGMGALLAMALACLLAPGAHGAGTPAGTTIANQALASYRSAQGTVMLPALSNTVVMIVRQAAVVNVTPVAASRVVQVNSVADFPVVVTNSGNGSDNFLLTARSSHGFAAVVYDDASADGVLQQDELSAGPVQQTGPLPADSSRHYTVRLSVPPDVALNGQTDLVTVTAVSAFDLAVRSSAAYAAIIASAALTMSLSVNNTVPRGGDRVTYTLSWVNGGSAAAAGVQASDLLDHFLTYVPSADSPPAAADGQSLAWDLGAIPSGASGALMFQADLAGNAVPGTEIHNVVRFHYGDGPNVLSGISTERNFITVQPGGAVTVDVALLEAAASGEPGDTVDFALTVTNNGTSAESFTLSALSPLGLSWSFYLDANANGRVDPGESMVTSTGPIPAHGGSSRIVARALLPVVGTDGSVDATTLTAASLTNPSNARSVHAAATLRIPVMTMTKTADTREPRSGGEILYQIRYVNSGGGHAYAFAIEDSIPARTTYVPESVSLDDVRKTDEEDGDEVQVTGGQIMARVGTVNPFQSGVLSFRVRID